MGKPHLFEIYLLNAQPLYLPGTWIEGVVQLRTKDSIKAQAIRLKLHGEEHTSWDEEETTGTGDDRRTTTHHYSRTIDIVNAYITLWGYPKHTDERTPHIAPGSYVFPFCVQIPPVDLLPPTYDFHRGSAASGFKAYVRYRLIAYINIPLASDIEVICPIRILPRIALTRVPGYNLPVELEEVKHVGCCVFTGGTVHVQVRCLGLGVLLGSRLLCTAEIINKSTKKVVGVQLALVNNGVFHACGSSTRGSKTLASADFPIFLQRDEAFSNLSCTAASANVVQGSVSTAANSAFTSRPFSLVLPFELSPGFASRAIISTYELVFRVRLEGTCVIDMRLKFSPTLCTRETDGDDYVGTMCTPSILNPTGQPRTAVLLLPASKGEHAVNFSFDGMDYRPTEQFDTSKQVSYPCFFDPRSDTVPESVNSYSAALMQELAGPVGSTHLVNIFAFPPPVEASAPVLATPGPVGFFIAQPEVKEATSCARLDPPPPYESLK